MSRGSTSQASRRFGSVLPVERRVGIAVKIGEWTLRILPVRIYDFRRKKGIFEITMKFINKKKDCNVVPCLINTRSARVTSRLVTF